MPEPQNTPTTPGFPPGFSQSPTANVGPMPSGDTIKSMAQDHGLDPDIISRQIQQESKGNPKAVSPKGAVGLMQLMPDTAAKWGVNPHDPTDNLNGGMSEMHELLTRFGGDYEKALAAYNAGAGTVHRYGGVPPFPETQKYVSNIMGGGEDSPVPKPVTSGFPAGFTASPGEAPTPVFKPTATPSVAQDTGVMASLKRNTVGAAQGMYHAFADDATPEELAHFKELGQRVGTPPEVYNNPSTASLAWYRMFEKPSDDLSQKGGAQIHQGIEDLKSKDPGYAPIVNSATGLGNIASGATNKVLSAVPMLGPFINSIAERAEKGDVSGAATDIATAWAAEHAPAMVKAGASTVSKAWDVAHAAGLMDQTVKDFTAAVPPTKGAPYTPQDYRAARVHLENEHVTSAPIKTVEDLKDAADSAIGKIEDHISDRIAQAPDDKITTNPQADVTSVLSKNPRGTPFALAGLKELDDFNLDQPKTVSEADDIRRQLNAENKAVLKRNNYDVATARAADPGFAAREAAAESIRNGLYDALKQRGTPGLDALRQEEGSLIKVRNAAQAQMLNGDKVVSSSSIPTTVQRVGQGVVKAGSTGAGAAAGGWPGAIIGREVGDVAANAIGPTPMSRNALVERAFGVKTSDFMGYPKGRVQSLPTTTSPQTMESAGPLFNRQVETGENLPGSRPHFVTEGAPPAPGKPGEQQPLRPQPPGPPTTKNPAQGNIFNEPLTLKNMSTKVNSPTIKLKDVVNNLKETLGSTSLDESSAALRKRYDPEGKLTDEQVAEKVKRERRALLERSLGIGGKS